MEFHVSLIGRKDLSGEIYRQLKRAILDGRLRPADPLPPSRELALGLRVSRTTVTVAYDRLGAEGFVTSRVGAGTFVSQTVGGTAPEAKTSRSEGALQPRAVWDAIPLVAPFARPARFDFRTGLPDASLFRTTDGAGCWLASYDRRRWPRGFTPIPPVIAGCVKPLRGTSGLPGGSTRRRTT
jgi:GntR family transcriptional regulator/MocR family aminotransferase